MHSFSVERLKEADLLLWDVLEYNSDLRVWQMTAVRDTRVILHKMINDVREKEADDNGGDL